MFQNTVQLCFRVEKANFLLRTLTYEFSAKQKRQNLIAINRKSEKKELINSATRKPKIYLK